MVETDLNEQSLICKAPIDVINSGKYNQVPLMLGYTSNEAVLLESMERFGLAFVIQDYEECVPLDLKLEKGSEASKRVANKIKKFYIGDGQERIKLYPVGS